MIPYDETEELYKRFHQVRFAASGSKADFLYSLKCLKAACDATICALTRKDKKK